MLDGVKSGDANFLVVVMVMVAVVVQNFYWKYWWGSTHTT